MSIGRELSRASLPLLSCALVLLIIALWPLHNAVDVALCGVSAYATFHQRDSLYPWPACIVHRGAIASQMAAFATPSGSC
jgi:hypothetical protein